MNVDCGVFFCQEIRKQKNNRFPNSLMRMSADTSGYIKGCCSPPSEVDARNKQERATPSHRDQTQTLPLPTDTYAKKITKQKIQIWRVLHYALANKSERNDKPCWGFSMLPLDMTIVCVKSESYLGHCV